MAAAAAAAAAAARVEVVVEVAAAVAEVAAAAIVEVAVETMIKKIRSVERVGENIVIITVIIGTTTVALQSMEKHNKCENDARKKREIIQKRESLMKT